VIVIAGNHTIGAPVVLGATTNVQVATGSQLSITGSLTATGQTLVKTGAGNLVVPHVRANRLDVQEGILRVAPNGTDTGTSVLLSLSINGANPVAQLDLTNNALVVDYTAPPPGPEAEPFDTIRAQIIAAYNGGGANAWTGNGITTSMGNAAQFGIGYAERSALGTVPAIFGTVDADAVLVRFTRYGDADLSGSVTLGDFNALAGNFGLSGKFWHEGDFNYDGDVNLGDFNLLAGNFGLSASSPNGPTAQDWAALAAAVPEPGSMLAIGMIGAAAVARRRRN
jgi:hypothetical protein